MNELINLLRKIKWIVTTNHFKKKPFQVIVRVLIWEIFKKFGKRMIFTFDGDLKIFLYPDDGVARLTFYFGYHEPEIFKFLGKFLYTLEGKEIVYCDIGANIGLYSLFVAKRLRNKGRVISFEPDAKTYNRFIENIKLNNLLNINAINKAVGDNNGYVKLVCNKDSAKTYVSKEHKNNIYEVELVKFDDFLIKNKITNVDYIKIDVEGFEFFVLLGMREFLINNPPRIIQIELYEEFLIRSGSSLNQIVSFLKILGFTFWKLNENTLKLYQCNNDLRGDLFLIHKNFVQLNKSFLNL